MSPPPKPPHAQPPEIAALIEEEQRRIDAAAEIFGIGAPAYCEKWVRDTNGSYYLTDILTTRAASWLTAGAA